MINSQKAILAFAILVLTALPNLVLAEKVTVNCTKATSPCAKDDFLKQLQSHNYTGVCTNPNEAPSRVTCVGGAKYIKCSVTGNSQCNCYNKNWVQGGEATFTVYWP